jgi:hypothetical protein
MKRSTTEILVYDNGKDEGDGFMEIHSKTFTDAIGTYTDYTITVGDTSLLVTKREFEELRGLMDEVMNDD